MVIPYILNYAADSSYADFLDAAADTGCETEISRTFLTVLSEDKHSALFGIMCETDIGRRYNYVDYNVRYSDILSHRGWKLYRLNILDWFDRGVEMPQAMTEFIKQNIR